MWTKLEGIQFGEGKIWARVAFYFDPTEEGYEECYRDVLDAEDKPTGENILYPFNSLSFDSALDGTAQQLRDKVLVKLRAFKAAHTKVATLQSWVGTVIKE